MRPVLLEMHGFAAFREPATVDFAGADYFALVGPTGSGKSTVIDAMTFALYGSVPRWDDRRMVGLAMAPSVNRGTVRLVFDAGGGRFVVARELRRSARGAVTVRNARLERLADPGGTGAADEVTEMLAADSDVTREIERLLGLPFDQFCQCVVLPQGDFADFLHAKPATRQQMLTRLLGIGVYEVIAREANREAAAAGERADVLAGQLAAYDDATDEAVVAAGERVAALAALSGRVASGLPELAAAEGTVAVAEEAVALLRAERSRLAALSSPPGLAELDSRRRAAVERAAQRREQVATGEATDTAARETRAAAPDRGPLEQARRDHADLAASLAARPGAEQVHAGAATAYASAVAVAEAATEAVALARAERDRAASALAAARETAERVADEHRRLADLRVPDGLDRLAGRRRSADDDLAAAQKGLDSAEAADSAAREDLAAAPPRGPLEQARADHRALAAALAGQATVRQRHGEALGSRTRSADQVRQARHRLSHARQRRDEAARADRAAALRPALVAGEPCPVCDQVVAALPDAAAGLPGAAGDAVAAAEHDVTAAEQAVEAARAEESARVAAEHRVAAEVDRLDAEITRLRGELAGAPPDAAATEAAITALDALAGAAARADEVARRARAEREDAARAVEAIRGEVARAAAALGAARDPLVALGAPAAPDDDVLAGWAALQAWAARETRAREAALPGVRAAATSAADAARAAGQALGDLETDVTTRRREETAAARAEQSARGDLDALDARVDRLRASLADAPPEADVGRELERLDILDAAVRAADAGLLAARDARSAAEASLSAVTREVTAAWDAMRAARDPLVALGAPAVTGDDLLAAWTALTGWAGTAVADRDGRLPAAERAVAEATERSADVERALADDLARNDVHAPVPLARTAEASVAAASARAVAAQERIAERRDEAARLRTDQADADTARTVAGMLGRLLRSDEFPRWLVASALDVLVADASANLVELSGGQFELAHVDGEFLVVDHADADARRPVKTLSGGETFQASLALALALSAQLSTLAAEGAARLDSIFLDEGFGTLDEANLEIVASTLETLASQGDRMVGVITHVPALAERVPVRYLVSRDQRTASVEREGA